MLARLLPALLPCTLLLAQTAHALELLDLQPGQSRSQAASILARQFPAAERLQPQLAAGHQPARVQPFDPAGCPGQMLCTAGWQELDAEGNLVRSEDVQVAIREETVMGLRHQHMQRIGADCAARLMELRAGWRARWGEAAQEEVAHYRHGDFLQQQWGECPAADPSAPPPSGSCLRAESGCDAGGRLESEVSLTDYARRHP